MLNQFIWPESSTIHAVNRLAQLSGSFSAQPFSGNPEKIDIKQYAESLGVEALEIKTRYGELAKTLSGLKPGIIQIKHLEKSGYLLIAQNKGRQLKLLAPEGHADWFDTHVIMELIYQDRGYRADTQNLQLLNELGLTDRRLQKAKTLLLDQQFAQKPIDKIWLFRPIDSGNLKNEIHWKNSGKLIAGFLVARLAERTALFGGVSLLAYAITQSVWTQNIVLSWLLIMLSYWLFSAMGQMCRVHLDVRLGLLIKQQLQLSALNLSPETQKTKGAATLLGQVMEADGLQHNALPGAFATLNALIDIVIGLGIALAIQQWNLAFLIIIFFTAKSFFLIKFAQTYRHWVKDRQQLSQLTIEHIQGNRTRLMQSFPEKRHQAEEKCLQVYWSRSLALDNHGLRLQLWVPVLWLICSSGILCFTLLFANLPMLQLAALLGAILLVWQAWQTLAISSQQLVRTWNSWKEIEDLLQPANNMYIQAHAMGEIPENNGHSELNANQISFAYQDSQQTLRNLSLHLKQGQQYLLQGESGSGKSTLLALLAGQTRPQQGWLLCNDRDLPSLGHRYWRKKICWVPQYHNNYLFSAPLLFNLLLGRNWPPTATDVEEAEHVCEKLGLTPLLEKMPAGILQSVGEMGWQLSQGERSRVFMARALLQKPDFLLLDESLGALDSATRLQILSQLKNEPAATLLCIHP
jgi:ATP-binding cassette, subfamily B, bacterial